MARNRFVNVNPSTRETVKVELSDGDWVLFKRELSNSEQRHVTVSALGRMRGGFTGSDIDVEWRAFDEEKVFTWLHGWSFVGPGGQAMQLNRENMKNLDIPTFNEIKTKLDEYTESKEKNSGPEPTKAESSGTTTGPLA